MTNQVGTFSRDPAARPKGRKRDRKKRKVGTLSYAAAENICSGAFHSSIHSFIHKFINSFNIYWAPSKLGTQSIKTWVLPVNSSLLPNSSPKEKKIKKGI